MSFIRESFLFSVVSMSLFSGSICNATNARMMPRMLATKTLLPVNDWLVKETQVSQYKIRQNIAPQGSVPGVVVASPQTQNPNYYHHWIRDAGITMDAVVELYRRAPAGSQLAVLETLLKNYVTFSRQNQVDKTLTGLGEPIFEVTGEVFQGPWGRPQNDGAAIRAIALIKWAHILLDRGNEAYVRSSLYTDGLPAQTVIKADLEYVAHHWQESSFDLWEEVRGDHFFTRMVQRRAMLAGAQLADRLKDPAAAAFYRQQAVSLSNVLNNHWDAGRGYVVPTLNWTGGANYKNSGIDIAVILGVLYGQWDQFMGVNDPRITATFQKIVSTFSQIYPINQASGVPGVAMGRYPEDKYSGSDFQGGNPWVLATLAGAEFMYDLAAVAAKSPAPNNRAVAKQLLAQGDDFVQRVQYHSNPDGSLSEQIQRGNGFMVSARDLTWNYAAVLRTAWAREQVFQGIRR